MKPRKMGKATLPPEGAPCCSVCVNFAWDGSIPMHTVKFGGVWHHPSCPQIRQARPRFDRIFPPREPSAVQRMLVLFRPLVIVAFYTLGASTIALATVAACAWMSG